MSEATEQRLGVNKHGLLGYQAFVDHIETMHPDNGYIYQQVSRHGGLHGKGEIWMEVMQKSGDEIRVVAILRPTKVKFKSMDGEYDGGYKQITEEAWKAGAEEAERLGGNPSNTVDDEKDVPVMTATQIVPFEKHA